MTFKLKTFDNNLKYIHIQNNNKLISIGFIIKVGSRDENKSNNGISHFLEHLLFKGTKKKNTNKFLKELDNKGIFYNAMTTYDYTLFELHGNITDHEYLLNIIIDMYLNLHINNYDFKKEKKVIIEEYNLYKDDSDEILENILMKTIFKNNNLSLPIIGNMNNIKKISLKEIINFKSKYYCPANTCFCTIGNINFEKISNILKKKIIKNDNIPNIRSHIIPQQNKPKLHIINNNNNLINVSIGFHHNGFLQEENYNTISNIISNYLTSGSSSKLYDILRTKNSLCYECSSNNLDFEDTSIFVIKTSVDKKNIDECILLILKELYKLKKYKIKVNDLNKCRKKLYNKSILNRNNVNLLNYYLEISLNKKIISYDDYLNKLISFTINDVYKASKHIFRNDNINIIINGKIKNESKKNIIKYLNNWFNN